MVRTFRFAVCNVLGKLLDRIMKSQLALFRWWETHGYEKVFEQYFACDGEINVYHGNCNTKIPDE